MHLSCRISILCVTLVLLNAPVGSADDIVAPGASLETLWEEGGFTEGVAAGPDGAMYFSDFAQPFESGPARVMRFSPESKKVTVYCPDSGMGNGLMFTRDGRLIGCCASPLQGHRALVEFLPTGKVKVLVDKYRGRRLNSPNDIVIDRHGRIYFSDPKYVGPEKMELDRFNVYRYDTDGKLHLATGAVSKPNGVILSPDQKTLYVAETDNGTAEADREEGRRGKMRLLALPVADDGSLGKPKVVVDFGDQTGVDGMTVDTQGRLYAAVRSDKRHGIYVFSPQGKELAYIKTPSLPTNCCFGRGAESKRLYVTAGGGLYRIRTTATGYHPALAE